MTASGAAVTAARQGRQALALASLSLQTSEVRLPALERAVESTAAASSALYAAEAAATTDEAVATYIHTAVDHLQRAVTEIETLRELPPELELAATSLARTLALLYPVLKLTLRQRRARLPAGALSDSDARELRTMAAFPRAPAPTGRFKLAADFNGSNRRTSGSERVFIEVEIGLSTESHFYTGLSLDVSTGGVFVATYAPAARGTSLTLYFVLPDGHVVNAEGVVRWTRAATEHAAPGMGVAFVNISRESLAHITNFCASRPPLYFDG